MIDLKRYSYFVSQVTSQESQNVRKLTNKLEELDKSINIALLMTGGIGLASEGGEFNEIVKKCVFQGKPLNEDTIFIDPINTPKIEQLYYSMIKAFVETYFRSYKELVTKDEMLIIKQIILSGGVGKKSNLLQNILKDYFKLDLIINESFNDAAYGAVLINQ